MGLFSMTERGQSAAAVPRAALPTRCGLAHCQGTTGGLFLFESERPELFDVQLHMIPGWSLQLRHKPRMPLAWFLALPGDSIWSCPSVILVSKVIPLQDAHVPNSESCSFTS